MIRLATLADINDLLKIEELCFLGDRLSKRRFRYLLTKAHACTVVEEQQETVRGYAMLLFNNRTAIARLYSLAVIPYFQDQGIASCLLKAIERIALTQHFTYLRLEVRCDNVIAQQMYEKRGYKKLKMITMYYDDQMDAFRFEKKLMPTILSEPGEPFNETLIFRTLPEATLTFRRR
jgi:ribosomal protein S18 acetylase RimI-like enzyme